MLKEQGGIKTDSDLQWCSGSSNDTVLECPVSKVGNITDFILIVHNPKPHNHTQFVRVKLPSNLFKPQVYQANEKDFLDITEFDILEQQHYLNSKKSQNDTFSDYEMFINHIVGPESVEVFRIVKTDQAFQFPDPTTEGTKSPTTLEIAGFSDSNEALFKYTNRD